MQKEIFPKEIIESTIEVHQFKHKSSSKILYNILLLTIIGVAISLPYIKLDIYASARGILRPEKELNSIISLYSGKIDSIYIKQNQLVSKGDTLLIVNNKIGQEQIKLIETKNEDLKKWSDDLNYLLSTKNIQVNKLKSLKYARFKLQMQLFD